MRLDRKIFARAFSKILGNPLIKIWAFNRIFLKFLLFIRRF